MADDQQNPFTMMGMLQMMQPNKYIDPAYRDKPLPMPGYYGTPTDASGQPIQSFTDAQKASDAWNAANPQTTTLNSVPQGNSQQNAINMALLQQAVQQLPVGMPDGGGRGAYTGTQDPNGLMGLLQQQRAQAQGQGQQQQGQTSSQAQNPVDMRQAYLSALSAPQGIGGKVPVPGATSQPSSPLGQPSVLNSFLSAQGPSSAGNYSTAPFFSTLNKLRSA